LNAPNIQHAVAKETFKTEVLKAKTNDQLKVTLKHRKI